MCRSGGKIWGNYYRSDGSKKYTDELSKYIQNRIDLIQTISSGPNNKRGTWIHPRVALHLAQWISPKCAVKVTDILAKFISGELVKTDKNSENHETTQKLIDDPHAKEKKDIELNEKKIVEKTLLLNIEPGDSIIYICDIGFINNIHYLKFGCTDNIHRRINEHKNTYGIECYLIFLIKNDHNRQLEQLFKNEEIIKYKRTSLEFKGNTRTELLTVDEYFTVEKYIEVFKNLSKKIPQVVKEEREYILQKQNNEIELKRVEIEHAKVCNTHQDVIIPIEVSYEKLKSLLLKTGSCQKMNSSVLSYLVSIRNFLKLHFKVDVYNTKHFENVELIITNLETIDKLSTRKNYLIAIIACLNAFSTFPSHVKKKYTKYLKEITEIYETTYVKKEITVTQTIITDKLNELSLKIHKMQGNSLDLTQQHLLLSLFTTIDSSYIDYAQIIIVKKNTKIEQNNDYIDLNSRRLILNSKKRKRCIALNNEIVELIKNFEEMKKPYVIPGLLINVSDKNAMTSNGLVKYVIKIFHPKKINMTVLRELCKRNFYHH